MSENTLNTEWLGKISYPAALDIQNSCLERVKSEGSGILLGLEHQPVITLGKRAQRDKDLKNILPETEVIEVDRGGEATLHSPGQLVIYPICPLRSWGLGVREFVQILENTTLRFLNQFGVQGFSGKEEPGLYSKNGKIAFFGIRIRHGVSFHGLSINVCNDLSLFQQIRSCGQDNESFDCLANYDINTPLKVLFSLWAETFQQSFSLTHCSRQINLTAL